MPDIRKLTHIAVAVTVFGGTAYSIIYGTYLDTSNPLLTHLPHPLRNSHYFADKSNLLNVYFIKKAWAWTSAAFFLLWFTSPPSTRTGGRILKWMVETSVWLIFTNWFFGPALFERIILASGGECLVPTPYDNPITVPVEYCLSKSLISPTSHPNLFTSMRSVPLDWNALPRLRKGHDVSGHIFLLTMSILFLADQLRHSFLIRQRSHLHSSVICINVSLICIWLFASGITSVYFHSPLEKFTGYCLGVVGFAATQW